MKLFNLGLFFTENYRYYLYMRDISSGYNFLNQISDLQIYFSESMACFFFYFLAMSFSSQTFLHLINSNLRIFFYKGDFGVISKISLPKSIPHEFSPMFSSKSI